MLGNSDKVPIQLTEGVILVVGLVVGFFLKVWFWLCGVLFVCLSSVCNNQCKHMKLDEIDSEVFYDTVG